MDDKKRIKIRVEINERTEKNNKTKSWFWGEGKINKINQENI